MPPPSEDDISSLEKARNRLYEPGSLPQTRQRFGPVSKGSLPHAWEETPLQKIPHAGKRHLRLATLFLIVAVIFFIISLGAAGYFFYYGGNSVSVDKVTVAVAGPTTIAGGDTVPLSLTITNKNPVAIDNASIEIDFPAGTLAADGSLAPDPRYIQNIGTIASGATETLSTQAIVFGGQGQALVLPVTFSYGTPGSSATFVKNSSYSLAITSTPLSVSVETLSEAVSGQPITFNLTVRSNATLPLSNVVLVNSFPFGFTETSASAPLNGNAFYLGTLQPGATKSLTLTGTLTGNDGDQRIFHFSVGTAKSSTDPTLALTYMTQDTPVTIAAPFISTTLAINGDTSSDVVVSPGSHQSVVVNYTNTLDTSVTNANISIALSGSAIDYSSIQTSTGFYNSTNHTIVFSQDTDPSLAQMAPGASGVGAFSFATLPATGNVLAPSITFTTSVSGTRVGQANVPETIASSQSETVKVSTSATLTASALHSSGPIANSGPIPPHPGKPTTYTIQWSTQNSGSPIAGAAVTAILPSYVSYTGQSAGSGSFSYDDTSRTVTWTVGDLAQGASAQGEFQVSITPSTSQSGGIPLLTSAASFSGYDRYAGVQISASADPVTTETPSDPGYTSADADVQ